MSARTHQAVVVCESRPGHGESVAALLVSIGYDVRLCSDEEALIEAMAARPPRAVVYELRHQVPVDLAILSLVRRVLPGVPLVVVSGPLSEHAVRSLRAVNPLLLTHDPVDFEELRAAVRRAVARSRRRVARMSAQPLPA
jgi:DNA-binding NtrC family response regulator